MADKSDIYDVLSYVAFLTAPITRAARAAHAGSEVGPTLSAAEREFIAFVLDHYVKEGVGELDDAKLAPLLKLHYGSIDDAKDKLGPVADIRHLFIGFQRYLYEQARAA